MLSIDPASTRAVNAPLPAAQDTPAKFEAQVQPDGTAGTVRLLTAAQDPLQGSAEALSVRYRFIEKYTVKPDPTDPSSFPSTW